MELSLQFIIDGRNTPMLLRPLEANDLEQIVRLQQTVFSALENKDSFHPDSPEFLMEILKKDAGACGLFHEKEMIGCFIIYCPGESENNLGRDLLYSSHDLEKVVHLESLAVHPQYRNCGIGKRLLSIMLTMSEIYGSVILTTCSPENLASLRIMFDNKMYIREKKDKFGGKPRFILENIPGKRFSYNNFRSIRKPEDDVSDLVKQGCYGIRLTPDRKMIIWRKISRQFATL